MRIHRLISAAIAVALMFVLWVLDPDRLVVSLGAIAWFIGLALLAVAIIRTGGWALDRVWRSQPPAG